MKNEIKHWPKLQPVIIYPLQHNWNTGKSTSVDLSSDNYKYKATDRQVAVFDGVSGTFRVKEFYNAYSNDYIYGVWNERQVTDEELYQTFNTWKEACDYAYLQANLSEKVRKF